MATCADYSDEDIDVDQLVMDVDGDVDSDLVAETYAAETPDHFVTPGGVLCVLDDFNAVVNDELRRLPPRDEVAVSDAASQTARRTAFVDASTETDNATITRKDLDVAVGSLASKDLRNKLS